MVKLFSIIFFIFFKGINLFASDEYHLRTTYKILSSNGEEVGYKVKLHDFYSPIFKDTHIYILENGDYFMLSYFPSLEYLDLQFQKNRFNKLEKKKDVGVEIIYDVLANINGNSYNFTLFGDTTYIYLKDGEGNVKKDEDAFEFMINKNSKIKDFIEIISCEKKHILLNIIYVLRKKEVIKKFNFNNKKYSFIEVFKNFSEIEKSLGFDCAIYRYHSPKD